MVEKMFLFFYIFDENFSQKRQKGIILELSRRDGERNRFTKKQRNGMEKGKPLEFNFQTIKRTTTDWKLAKPSRLETRLRAAERQKATN